MRHLLIGILATIMLCAGASAQMQKGDKEVQLLGSIDAVKSSTSFTAQLTYGVMVTPNLELGVGPSISRYGKTLFSMTFFGRYNFSLRDKMVPYLSGQWYQSDFAPPDPAGFFDASYIQVGGGAKFFVNPNVAYDVSGNLGFGLGGGAALRLLGGLSYFF